VSFDVFINVESGLSKENEFFSTFEDVVSVGLEFLFFEELFEFDWGSSSESDDG
jgi:hypothetical protein